MRSSFRKGSSMSLRKGSSMSLRKQSVSVKKADPNKPPNDKFESMMIGFHTMACNKVDALDKAFKNLQIFAGNVAVFFGEHDDLEWEELFKIFLKTFALIQKAIKQNADVAAKAEKERKRLEREKKKKERMAK